MSAKVHAVAGNGAPRLSDMSLFRQQAYVDGAWIDADSGETIAVTNPATGEVQALCPYASAQEVDSAVQAALAAQPEWEATAAPRRAAVIFKFRELVMKHTDELAEIVGREHGKTIEDAKGSIQRGLDVTEFACGIPHLLKGELSTNVGGGIDTYSMREAVGVDLLRQRHVIIARPGLSAFPSENRLLTDPESVGDGRCAVLVNDLVQGQPIHGDGG